jgi:hypothetical protein
MTYKLQPQYFGVAATTNSAEVAMLEALADKLELPKGVLIMNGPLISRRVLAGEAPSDPAQYRLLGEIARLLTPHPGVFNILHFNSRDPQLHRQLAQIVELDPKLVAGIQLNIPKPDPVEIAAFKRDYPSTLLVYQVSRATMAGMGGELRRLVEYLKSFEGLFDYALFDQSGGEGIEFDPDLARRTLTALVESGLLMRWGVTGGLAPHNLGRLRPLLEIYPGLCWDAQSSLRSRENAHFLDVERCRQFCEVSAELWRDFNAAVA